MNQIQYMGLVVRKPIFGGLQTTQAQTSLRISAVWSTPLLFAFWKVSYLDLLLTEFQLSVSVAEQADLKLALLDTPKTGFVATRPTYYCFSNEKSGTEIFIVFVTNTTHHYQDLYRISEYLLN